MKRKDNFKFIVKPKPQLASELVLLYTARTNFVNTLSQHLKKETAPKDDAKDPDNKLYLRSMATMYITTAAHAVFYRCFTNAAWKDNSKFNHVFTAIENLFNGLDEFAEEQRKTIKGMNAMLAVLEPEIRKRCDNCAGVLHHYFEQNKPKAGSIIINGHGPKKRPK